MHGATPASKGGTLVNLLREKRAKGEDCETGERNIYRVVFRVVRFGFICEIRNVRYRCTYDTITFSFFKACNVEKFAVILYFATT